MKNKRKIRTSIIIFFFLLCGVSYGQTDNTLEILKKNPNTNLYTDENGCLRPIAESQGYGFWKVIVTKIKSANKIEFKVAGKKFVVKLVGIDKNFNKKEIKSYLSKIALGKEVWITANLRNDNDTKFLGMVDLIEDKNTDDLSQQLIKLGLAKFKSFDNPYLVPAYIECRLLNAQEKAQNAKLGIWAKINNER